MSGIANTWARTAPARAPRTAISASRVSLRWGLVTVSVSCLAVTDAEPDRPQNSAGLSTRVYCTSGALKMVRTARGIHVRHEHLEHVESRRNDELVFMGQEQRVQTVDQLGDIRHRDFISMTIERVQRQTGKKRIAHR
jgi:hypothetical protein